ncbi:MAG: xanthine dehydrogenase family protein subunit M [Acidimicrobiia bacterium]|nr:xanthine dehydrogenase family protein subunit M [Acidimicrobiia bacterium]
MEFVVATNLEEAVSAVAAGAVPLAGGTDLMVGVNSGDRPESVVGLRRVEELREISRSRIGSGARWRVIEKEGPRALAQAARTVGSPQIRNAGTLGGNVGTASPAGDGLPFLAAVDASIELTSASGTRTIRWDEYFTGVKETARRPDEIITAVVFPDDLPERQEFAKIGVRNAMVIATVACVVTRRDDGTTTVALASVAPTPIRVPEAEEMAGTVTGPNDPGLDEFGRLVAAGVSPITDHRSTEEYRRHGAGVLARRLLARCLAA